MRGSAAEPLSKPSPRTSRAAAIVAVLGASAVAAGVASGCWLTSPLQGVCDPCPNDGGATSSASSSSSTTSGTGPCTIPGAVLCEGFEHGLPAAPLWKPLLDGSGSVTVDGAHAHQSKLALHAHADPGSKPSALLQANVGAQRPYYVRFFVYAPPAPMNASDADNFLAVFTEPVSYETIELRVSGPPPTKVWALGDSKTTQFPLAATAFSFDTWTCVEHANLDDGLHVWVWGNELADLRVQTTTKSIYQEAFGWSTSGDIATPLDLWIDDVVIGTAPIGCTVQP